MNIKETRLANLLAQINPGESDLHFCNRIDLNPSYMPQLKSGLKTIGDKIARRSEERLGLPHGFLDIPQDDETMDSDLIALARSLQSLPQPLRAPFRQLALQVAALLAREDDEITPEDDAPAAEQD